jgi:hypothetical protein
MAHKIKVSGEVKKWRQVRSPLNDKQFWYLLDIPTGGSPASPKGLPKASQIEFTAIVNERVYKSLNADLEEFGLKLKGSKVFIDGEITLDQPMDIVPGEIGILVYQIGVAEVDRLRKEQQAAAAAAEEIPTEDVGG